MHLSLLGEQDRHASKRVGLVWVAYCKQRAHRRWHIQPACCPLQACQAMEHLQHTLEAPALPTQSTLLRRTLDVVGSDARTLFDVVQASAGYCGPITHVNCAGALPTYSGSTFRLSVWLRKGCQAP